MTDTVVVTELSTGIVEVVVQGPQGPAGLDSIVAGGVLAGTYPNPSFAADMATQAELDSHTGNASNPHNVTKTQVGLGSADNTSDTNKPVSTAQQTALNLKENAANKDASGGYAGLTLFKLNLRNAANTITSWFTTAATVARTWTMPDKDGTVAMTSDITGTNSGTNTGDQTISLTGGVTGSGTGSFAATVVTNANLTGDVTSVGNATTLTNAPVIAKVLTGYVSGAGTVAATDSILQAIQKLNGNDATNANLTGHITSVGNAAVLGSFTSAQLKAALTDETGSGAAVFSDTPTLVTPILGVATATSLQGIIGNVTPAAGTFTTLTSTGNATLGDAEAADTHAIKGATTLLANSASAALTVTQTGTGNAFVVEDSTSVDSTPFSIDSNGLVTLGAGTAPTFQGFQRPLFVASTNALGVAQAVIQQSSLNSSGPTLFLAKTRGTTPGSKTTVASGDSVGQIEFVAADGTSDLAAARILAEVDGTPGTNDMPGRLVFSTTADGASSPTERMRIDNAGNVGIGGTANAYNKLYIAGTLPTGSSVARGVEITATVPSGATGQGLGFLTALSTQAAAFTLTNMQHYVATQGTIGAASAITTQIGFEASSSLTGATNNYGFYSNIALGSNRYNFYAAGTADNYFAGTIICASVPFVKNATATPAGGTAAYYMGSANMALYFGSGAPTVSAAKGSLYLRSDGSATNNRMYVNTDGGTTWTAVTTTA